KKGELSPWYIGPFRISKKIDNVAYELDLPSELAAVHPVFHISILHLLYLLRILVSRIASLGVKENLFYKEVSVEILDRQVKKLRNKEVASVKVLWRN
ncbi:hypothetical protein MTR67_044235, partial [Solanum verrucosum]